MFNAKTIENAIEDNATIRILRSKLSSGNHRIIKMKDQLRNTIWNNRNTTLHIKGFYADLYISTRPDPRFTDKVICNVGSESVLEISKEEIKKKKRNCYRQIFTSYFK